MRRLIYSTLALLAAAAVAPSIASAKLVVQNATPLGFTTNNATLISNWWWLRAPNARATWTFDAHPVTTARVGTVYVLLSPLVTNRTDGGSGYSRSIEVVLRGIAAPGGTHTTSGSVSLYNPFRPIVNEDTNGVGYQTYGYESVPSSIWRPSPLPPSPPSVYNPRAIYVTIEWTPGYHVAVNRDAVRLAYVTP